MSTSLAAIAAASLLALLMLCLTFYAICVVCDDHLVPIVEVFIKIYNVPEEMAAVTLVALGSAAPELILNMVAAVLGSALIAFGLIPPLCLLCTTHKKLPLKIWPIVRETCFYLFGLLLFLHCTYDGVMTLFEALLITSTYVFYVSTVFYIYYINKDSNNTSTRSPAALSSSSSSSSLKSNDSASIGDEERAHMLADSTAASDGNNTALSNDTVVNVFFKSHVKRSVENTLNFLIPPLTSRTGEITITRSLTAMAMCVACISVLTTLIVFFCSVLVAHLGIGNSTIGATLVALGSEIPDTISSVALARNGYFDAAMAGAIGSQVINISLGVGLPALLLCIMSPDLQYPINEDMTRSLWLLCSMLIVVVSAYVCATLPVLKVITCSRAALAGGTHFYRTGAVALLAVFAAVYFVFIYNNEA